MGGQKELGRTLYRSLFQQIQEHSQYIFLKRWQSLLPIPSFDRAINVLSKFKKNQTVITQNNNFENKTNLKGHLIFSLGTQ